MCTICILWNKYLKWSLLQFDIGVLIYFLFSKQIAKISLIDMPSCYSNLQYYFNKLVFSILQHWAEQTRTKTTWLSPLEEWIFHLPNCTP